MTDAGYVLGGYGVTVVAIGSYIGYMWARNRSVVRLTGTTPRSGHASPASGDAKRDQNAAVSAEGSRTTTRATTPTTAPPPDDRR